MKQSRIGRIERTTKETAIRVVLNLDGTGRAKARTGIPFLDHMLELFGKHGLFDLEVVAKGDLDIDRHHTNEDVGICLGEALKKALGAKTGIRRFGAAYVPMEEALARVTLDVSGRPRLVLRDQSKISAKRKQVPYTMDDAEHLLESVARGAGLTIHVDVLSGNDTHHTLEGVFKAFGRALAEAVTRDPRVKGVPSTKGRL